MAEVLLAVPPRVKVLEALGAVAGGRIKVLDDRNCLVDASEGTRTYKVYVDIEKKIANSDDNGTFYRNYIGYPIIAFLMVKGLLSYDPAIATPLAEIKWRTLNERYKSYWKVETLIKKMLAEKGVKPEDVDRFVSKVLDELAALGLRKQAT
ncbi:MAG: hypothetical protein QW074_06100 [Candidatus Caldarchaeum sp.]|uniref:Uncharacterized protein n=1 Tax=Caldiarchaeum subterraneum TaxID=311458 RepID=A0A7J3WBF3_CALS0